MLSNLDPPAGSPMSKPEAQDQPIPADPVEEIVSAIPFVLPLAGGVLIFLLAFIAVTMA